jgi:hypothetical protein
VIVAAVKVPLQRKGSSVMRTLGYALALIAVGCSQQSRKLRNSNYELVDGLCTATCANSAILGGDWTSIPLREKAGGEVRAKESVGLSAITSSSIRESGNIEFLVAAESSAKVARHRSFSLYKSKHVRVCWGPIAPLRARSTGHNGDPVRQEVSLPDFSRTGHVWHSLRPVLRNSIGLIKEHKRGCKRQELTLARELRSDHGSSRLRDVWFHDHTPLRTCRGE